MARTFDFSKSLHRDTGLFLLGNMCRLGERYSLAVYILIVGKPTSIRLAKNPGEQKDLLGASVADLDYTVLVSWEAVDASLVRHAPAHHRKIPRAKSVPEVSPVLRDLNSEN